MTAMMVMTMLPLLPRAKAYIWTNGCGASNAKTVSRSGVQNKKSIVVIKPKKPVAITLVSMPLPEMAL
jgi:hypothetical protein